MAITQLVSIADGLIADSLAPCLAASLQVSPVHIYTVLCLPKLAGLPASEQVLLLFVADLSQRVTHGTARCYLSAVRHGHLSRGLPDSCRKGKTRLCPERPKKTKTQEERPASTNYTTNPGSDWALLGYPSSMLL